MTIDAGQAHLERLVRRFEQLNDPDWCEAIVPFKEEVSLNLNQLFADTTYAGPSNSPASWAFILNMKGSGIDYSNAPIEAIAQKLYDDICDEIMDITTEPSEVSNIFESNKESYQNRVIQALEDMEEYFE